MNSNYHLRVITLLLLTLLTACVPTATPAGAPAAQNQADSSAFPVTINHKYGSTTITAKPERIVLVGLVEQDALLALGVVPVATSEWWGDRPGAIFEWATDELGDAPLPEVLSGETPNFERIAALQPDVIVGLYAGLTAEQYETLAQIAPTVAQPAEHPDWGIPWQELTHKIGLIVGKRAEADQLIAELEARIAQIREQHPEFAEAGALVASYNPENYWAYSSKDPRGQFLTALGFQPAVELDEIIGNEFGTTISRERMDLLNDMGVVIWFTGDEQSLRNDQLYQQLDVSKEGRDIVIGWDAPMAYAYSFNSVLSLPYVLDHLVPQIVDAADGAPAAATTATIRTITDAKDRQVEVSSQPVRIVALTELDLDSALALGITPVGAVNGRGQTALPAYLGDKAAGIVSVGTLAEPSLEAIVALDPDLILAGSMIEQIEALLPQLSEIAPVVATYKPTDDWKSAFQSIATVLNQESAAATFLGEYEHRVATIKALLPTDKATEANVARWMPQGPVLMMPTIFSSLVLADVGITRPAAIAELAGSHGAHTDPLSLEALDLLDSEWLFLGALNPEGGSALEAALDNPLFQQLTVVQNNQVVVVDGAVWTSIGGPLAALVVLDDLEAALQQ